MTHRNHLIICCIALLIASALVFAQSERGKSELKTPNGTMTLDYGRPSLQGRDMLAKLEVGQFWRLGKDEVTILSTPVNLAFGSTKIPKGTHGLWLKRAAPDAFELVFNKQVTGHGMMHDAAKDVATVPLAKSAIPKSEETLAIDLLPASTGGTLAVRWGTTRLAANFQFAK
ncbi:MAG: hypothetical protein H6Q07_1607 [Acidobacteria bacterium]|nr:hypothetical protein [Acidobacteriota bacterium]